MPPRKSKAKAAEDDVVEQTPVRRSARTRRSAAHEEYDELEDEPPKKRARSARASASTAVNYEEENSNETVKHPKKEEIEQQDEELPKTPAKSGRGRGRKVSEHKDTPYPKNASSDRIGNRGRKRREASEPVENALDEDGEVVSESSSAIKKSKLDLSLESPQKKTAKTASIPDVAEDRAVKTKKVAKGSESVTDPTPVPDDGTKAKTVLDKDADPSVLGAAARATADGEGPSAEREVRAESPRDGSDQVPQNDSNVTNGDGEKAKIKPPTGVYEENIKIGDMEKDLTVASFVSVNEAKSGTQSTKAILETLDNPDIVAIQKSTLATAHDAETCGFNVFGDGATRLLVRKRSTANSVTHIDVKEPPETQSLILLALNELNEVTCESNRKCVEDYLRDQCTLTDEFTVFTLNIDGADVTLVNVQLESRNRAVTSLLIGCLMRKLDSRPHAFILTGYMPHVRPGTPAYELLRDGYFSNHSIETLQGMRDIKMDDEEERNKGLIDFFWKAYQHSRPWMRSVYETVLDGESVISGTGQAVIWHSTKGVEAVRVFNHASIVKADLAVRSES